LEVAAMKVLLVQPDSEVAKRSTPEEYRFFCEPLALEYLTAAAEARGHTAHILDLRVDGRGLAEIVTELAPDVVGTTGYSCDVPLMHEICRVAKSTLPQCRTVIGGHHATQRPADFFRPWADFVMSGEGVHSFCDLLDRLQAGEPPTGVDGLWHRVDGTFTGGEITAVRNLSGLPRPKRTATRGFRHRYGMGAMKSMASLRTSEGCPYRCSFCTIWKTMEGHYRQRSADSVAEELAEIEEPGVFLIDDEPWVGARRMWNIRDAIKAAGIRKNYVAYCRVDSINGRRDLLEAWQEIGLHCLLVGIETVRPSELADYNKASGVAAAEEALAYARAQGLMIQGLFIVHPQWDRKDFAALRRFIERQRIDHPTFTVLTPLPGTDTLGGLGERVTARTADGEIDWAKFDLLHPVTETTLPPKEFERELTDLFRLYKPVRWPGDGDGRERGSHPRAMATAPAAEMLAGSGGL
jgi:radical SAM superfamily enzyme YgiQ (UPF0313 family)